ncbi:hypothetical protein G6F56_002564 [Rhizopus delemar]|uniref:NuA3 HAT complex component nto1 n=1 Tax=Rhizopus stolonifer TaxID=4846 RepID=A0A367KNU0_RHIST|nr:hypothetical protein G6F56_002564 [Rhizopus delemar]RCI03790.1 nuA3 HAT complex component nto1 [Rhizopus stolonifer]
MPANKTRRGRPKRMYDLVQEDEHQKHNSVASTSNLPDLDIRQPLTIYTQVDDICPEEKPCLVHLNQDVHLGSTTHAQINYDNLPQAVYLMNEPEDDDDPEITPYIIQSEYIRYQEPTEDELFERVEYDMDERDQIWLNNYNEKNCADNDAPVSPELFEGLMDRLEKEWHILIQGVSCPADLDSSSAEDSACAVCGDTEAENSNAIVFCDGCNLAVHQDCYGIPHIPEGEWLCKQCQLAPDEDISCVFCPNKGGAFKQTTDGKWGHLLCAIWIPEVILKDTVYMEPIDYVDKVPKGRLRLVCSICKQRQGACIQCDNKNCYSAFHVSCARATGYSMKIKLHEQGSIVMNAYCDKHMPKDTSEDTSEDIDEEAREDIFEDMPMEYEDSNEEDYTEHDESSKKKGRQTQGRGRDRDRSHSSSKKIVLDLKTPIKKFPRAGGQHHVTGPPIAPNIVLSRMDHIPRLLESSIRKKSQLVTSISRYWSLKREYMKGAPLIKRLQLEPWVVTNYIAQTNNVSGRLAPAKKEFILDLWASLDKSRMLSEQVQRRERLKLEQLKKQKEYVETYLYPNEYVFHIVLNQLIECDSNDYFKEPVSHEDVPDYASVIDEPMCFSIIQEKITCHGYTELGQLKRDVDLIWDNCVEYNLPLSDFYKAALRLKKKSEAIFDWAEKKITSAPTLEEFFMDSCTDSALESSLNPVLSYSMFDCGIQEEDIDIVDEEVIEIADEEDTELPMDVLVDSQPIVLPTELMEVAAVDKTSDISADSLPRRAGRRRISKSASENYTILETGTRQSTIEQWILQNSGKPAVKKKHKRETKKIPKPTAVQKEHEIPTVTSVDVGVQTDNYLLLSLLQEFGTPAALGKLADEKQNDKELYNGLSLAKAVSQKIKKITRNPLPKTLPEPIKVIDTDTISDNNSTDTEQEVIVTIKSPKRRRSVKLQKSESPESSSPVMAPIKLPEACSSGEPQATESLETSSFNKPRKIALSKTSPAKPQTTVSPEGSFFGKSQATNLPERSSSVKPQRTLLPGKITPDKPQVTESPKRNSSDEPQAIKLAERSSCIKPQAADSKERTSVKSQRTLLPKKSTSDKSRTIESPEKSISGKPQATGSTVDNSSVKPQRISLPEKGASGKLQVAESTERITSKKVQGAASMDRGLSIKPQATKAPERSLFVEPPATKSPEGNSSAEPQSSKNPMSSKADLSPSYSMSYDIAERSLSPVAPMENILAEPSNGRRTVPQSLESVVNIKEGKRSKSSPKPQPAPKTIMRATRSRGLTANEEELKKRKRMSTEARVLMSSLLHFENKEKPEEKYKTYYPKNAPVGWAYLESDDEDGAGHERTEETKAESRIKRRKIEQVSLDDFNHNEIVWARVSGYPSHPAKLVKEVDENSSLYKSKRVSQAVLVEFLKVPDNHKWGWVLPNNITKFGATEVDKLKLAECLKEKGSARTSRIQEAREGYQYACSLIDKEDSESVLGSVFSEANLLVKKKTKSTKRK